MAEDAKKQSQLISRSLRQELAKTETDQLTRHLDSNEQSRQFAQLSRIIQGSAAHAADQAAAGQTSDAPQLSSKSKQRMKDSIAVAALEKQRLSQAGLIEVGEDGSASRSHNDGSVAPNRGKSDEPSGLRQSSSRFRLLRRLGEGGLGNVWLARDERLNRSVAVKELTAEALESPKAWQRFYREAEITGHLEHPNIVPIYQFGDDRKSGEPFYTMRFVGKRTLSDAIVEHHDRVNICQSGPLGLHRLLSVFLDVCQAIAYAHSRGVVHRDLKPENVAVDNFGQVTVLDWGLAKLTEDGELANQLTSDANLSDSSMTKTMQGDVIGTPLYMAPEQAAGDLDKVNELTDVYGLGAILFAILTGKAPHEQSFQGQHQFQDVLRRISEEESPRPRDVQPCLPTELEEICRQAMSRKPHLRFDGVQALADAVEHWMAGQSEKKARYESLRMEGRELRAELQSIVSDLERNTRFMAGLPPIQQLIAADSEQDVTDWRNRLASIFQGLLGANPDYKCVMYCRVDGEQFTELVRVERHSKDVSRIRIVPRSRLRESKVNDYLASVMQQKPEEVVTSLVADPTCDADSTSNTCDNVGLVAGVPIYDDITEDTYGVVMIECNIEQVLRRQMSRSFAADEVLAACDVFHVMMQNKSGHIAEENLGKRVADRAGHFMPAVDFLQNELEYLDETNGDIYGARIWFIPNKHGLMYLLKRKDS